MIEYKNLKILPDDLDIFKQQSAGNRRPMIAEFTDLVRNPETRTIDGVKYRVVPMDSDNLTRNGSVRPAKMARSNRVGKDG